MNPLNYVITYYSHLHMWKLRLDDTYSGRNRGRIMGPAEIERIPELTLTMTW